MRILKVNQKNYQLLVSYAAKYGAEHDSSYLPGRDLEFSEDVPSFLLIDDDDVIGAVSLMRTKRFLSVGKGRFSIFHSKTGQRENYSQLLDAVRPNMIGLKSVFMFIPEKNDLTAGLLIDLGFEIERYSFILERSEPALSEPDFPDGIHVHPLDSSDHEGISQFADCLNKEFKGLAGHSPSTAEDIKPWFEDQSYLDGGLCLLKKGKEAIGTIALYRDMDDLNGGEIGAFGILEQYRGMDLGRNLLRYGINFLHDKGFIPIVLSVNGENHGAIKLYQKEGFDLTDSVVCYAIPGESG